MTMFISSVDHFRGVLLATLYRAQLNLVRDGDLYSAALFRGPHATIDLSTAFIPLPLVGPVIKNLLKTHADEVEYVLYVTLGSIALYEECTREQRLPAGLDNQSPCILVEGAHPDFGGHSVHVLFDRPTPKEFVFKEIVIGTMKSSPMLDGLWPKRRLNS
jgi:hypothetical protein